MTLIYIDTNVYLDYLEIRTDRLRPLHDFAFQLFRRTFSCEFTIACSQLVINELHYNIQQERIDELFRDLKQLNKIIMVGISRKDKMLAHKLVRDRGTPKDDTIHAIVAKRLGASYLVTRNIKDFAGLQDIISLALPENL
jgi:predicted nucleic acid-binding protein